MQPRRCMRSAFALGAAMFFGTSAMAADLPKEGTYGGPYYAFGTLKATRVGKELILFVIDENGLSQGNGWFDHMTWHCWGMASFVNGVGAPHGSCVGTDPAGDQISRDWVHEKWSSPDAKNVHGSFTITEGTGKFAGVSGGHSYVARPNEFRTAVEGTYVAFTTNQRSYKLPWQPHGAAPARVASTNRSVAASIARPLRPRGAWI